MMRSWETEALGQKICLSKVSKRHAMRRRERTRLGKESCLKGVPKVLLEMTGPETRLQVVPKIRNQAPLETTSQGTGLHVLLKGESQALLEGENRALLKGKSQEALLKATS